MDPHCLHFFLSFINCRGDVKEEKTELKFLEIGLR